MTTQQMLEALALSGSEHCKRIAIDIKEGRDTIENQKTICEKFLQNVFDGKYQDAFRVADNKNKHAFIVYLLNNGEDEKAHYLIKRNFFDYR